MSAGINPNPSFFSTVYDRSTPPPSAAVCTSCGQDRTAHVMRNTDNQTVGDWEAKYGRSPSVFDPNELGSLCPGQRWVATGAFRDRWIVLGEPQIIARYCQH